MQLKQRNSIAISLVALVSFITPSVSLAATGMGTPTVEDCVSRTGQTKAQCTEMINKFKNMSPSDAENMKLPSGATEKQMPSEGTTGQMPASKKGDASSVKPNNAIDSNQVVSDIDAKIERATRIRVEKEQQFIQVENRVEKIIEFLKSKNIGTTEIESNLDIFKTKAISVLGAFDEYVQALSSSKTDISETAPAAVQSTQAQIKMTITDLINSYGTLRNSLSASIEKITQ
ncbi:MAG: hypothetical protein Athens101428_134 [Candidatus Berkelbacteria bacterium Athens1014_28]|uniref:Uncharacterized protein n=1 Tax=Candidatus Berkelbacteria bacterium Athens1014_28 TaxID=2017145 RepID=A0A554LPP8_9BACT|nr:MAG: hypothetical protein Athens101428_134 [Candidatus Berkelbacteria bacterium Athens1014_28]